jgi:O-antigen/teichoic acid export membrane protein
MTSTTLLSMTASIVAAKMGASIVEVFWAQNAAYILRWIWLTITVKRHVPQWKPNPFSGSMKTFKMIFGLSAWMLALQIASLLNYKFDEIIIGAALPVAMLTVYAVITRPFKLVQEASGMFNSAVMPAVSAHEARQGRAGLDIFIYTGVRYNNLLVAPLAITTTYFCAPFIALWVGERFLDWIWVAQVACVFQMVWQSNSMLGRVFYGTGKVERIAMIALVSAVLNATLSIFLVPSLGIAGVILATVIVGSMAVPAQYIFVFPLLDIPRWRYFKTTVLRAQWPHWVAGLLMIPLWSWIQQIRQWWVLAPCALVMLFGLLMLSWRFGVEADHKVWIADLIRTKLKPKEPSE